MVRAYARLSVKLPYFHWFNVILTFAIFVLCCYQLLANEEIIFSFGFIIIAANVILFAMANSYRQKYLTSN